MQEEMVRTNTMGGGVRIVETLEQWTKIFEAAPPRKLIVVCFSASWCGPCKRIFPEYVALAAANPDVWFVKIDVDISRQEIEACNTVRSLPSYVLIRDRKQVGAMKGAHLKQLKKLIRKNNMPTPNTEGPEEPEEDPKLSSTEPTPSA